MRLLGKYKMEILISFALAILYFATRLYHLLNLPIFTDEAIYIRWAQIALHDASWRFISLTDGKPPLQTWIMIGFLKIIKDPLLAGRLVSVASGFGSMLGIWFLTKHIFKNRSVAYLAALLYIFYPLALLHDRLALEDSLSAMWYVWSLYLSLLLLQQINLGTAYTLGIAFGAGILTKSIGFISMALFPFTLIIFPFGKRRQQLLPLICYGLLALIIGFVMYNILRLSPLYGMITMKNDTVFIYPLSEWLSHPWSWRYALATGNMHAYFQWFTQYFNVTYLIFLLIGLLAGKFYKEKIVLAIYFVLPLIYASIFGKVLFPRYLLFMTEVLLPIMALGVWQANAFLSKIKANIGTWSMAVLTIIALIPTTYVCLSLLVNPLSAAYPESDYNQYIGSWPAGWGVQESIAYLSHQAQTQKIYIATEGTFGLMPAAFEMYLIDNPNVTIKGYWPIRQQIPAQLLIQAKKMPTYIYFYQPCAVCPSVGVAPATWPVVPVITINKDQAHAVLYKVRS